MRFHLIAIGGAVMHNLALALKDAGHIVTGSDDEIYNPSRSRLEAAGLLPDKDGWDTARISSDIDMVILGMHAREDNPEMHRALELGLPIKSFPEFIYEMSKNKKRIVVGGSHGKTTTTSMIMHACRYNNVDIDYLVGAQLEGFNNMVRLSDADIIVVEGDEYPSSTLDKQPKFLHYRPHVAVITGIAWDHINVFPVYADYVSQFASFVKSIEAGGRLFYYGDDAELTEIATHENENILSSPYDVIEHRADRNGVSLIKPDGSEVSIPIFGKFNMSNLSAAQAVCAVIGISKDDFIESIRTFKGAAKRQQILGKSDEKIVYLDFAHAPSKVTATCASMVERYGAENIIAALELHTFSSLSRNFLPEYKGAFNKIQKAMVFYSPHTIKMKRMEPILPAEVKTAFQMDELEIGHEAEDILRFLEENSTGKSVLLLMSSGKFGGIDLQELATDFLEGKFD